LADTASSQTPLGELTVLPQTLYLGLRGLLLRHLLLREGDAKGSEGRGEGAKIIYAPGATNPDSATG